MVRVLGCSDPEDSANVSTHSKIFVLENKRPGNPSLENLVRTKVLHFLKKRFPISSFKDADYYLHYSYGISQPQTHSRKAENSGSDSGFFPEFRHVYDREFQLRLICGEPFRESGKIKTKWCGDVSSRGNSPDLNSIFQYLLIGAFEYFGNPTVEPVHINIYEDDPRVYDSFYPLFSNK